MTDISVVILAGNEVLHIRRCLEKLLALSPQEIVVVESTRGDETHDIAMDTGAICVFHEWPGNQADQFNWAIDNLELKGKWILRIDADEYLLPELIDEIGVKLPLFNDDVAGVVMKRRHYFAGGWAKHGTYPVKILRMFRTGRGRYAAGMVMDEHLIVKGKTVEFENDFVDHSLISMTEWREKHRGYAKREAAQAIESMRTGVWTDPRKASYYKLPRYFRAFAYFCIRYFLKGGFLDGYAGWMWNFWQGLWYRWLVDREIGRMKMQHKG